MGSSKLPDAHIFNLGFCHRHWEPSREHVTVVLGFLNCRHMPEVVNKMVIVMIMN